ALSKSWNAGYPLLNRLVFAQLESLSEETFQQLLFRFLSDGYLLRADHKKIERIYQLCKASGDPSKLILKLIELLEKCVHNAFHYEVQKFAEGINEPALFDLCLERLKFIEALMSNAENLGVEVVH
ncbi:MAG TPA: hypothetical protein VL495_05955, partial [Edaphobacter sp.]|nr:hypothetical protein [Edaphobacter sp.]